MVDLLADCGELLVARNRLAVRGASAKQSRRPGDPVLPKQRVRPPDGRAPRSLDGRGSARERQLLEMRHAPVPEQIADEELAAPQAPIVAVAQTVHAHADRRPPAPVLHQASGDVRMVVLHGDLLLLRQRPRELGRQVLGVQVVADHLRAHAEQTLVPIDAGLEGLQSLEVLEVADVLAEKGVGIAREAEGALEFGAAAERLRERPRQR